MGFLDLLYPKKCVNCNRLGNYLCDNCFALLSYDTHVSCSVCQMPSFDSFTHPGCRTRLGLDGRFAVVKYNRPVKKLVRYFKYGKYLRSLDEYISEIFIDGIIQDESLVRILKKNPVLVPVPLHNDRLRKRGYNHAELLSIRLSEYFNLEIKESIERTRVTKSQYGLTLLKRQENLRNAFRKREDINSKNVIIIDDVTTTGSTLREIAKVLKRSGGVEKVYGLAFAHGN